ncbi:MAG: hypothetical protein GY717_09500 [Rhodobacteraceae bacterium]|nr:hypothetical protein [Paracoccaceae bacterium]
MFGLKTKTTGGTTRHNRQQTEGPTANQQNPRTTGLASGMVTGTRVATAMGWRPVEAIAEGDLVLTFDRGLQPVRTVIRGSHWDAASACPQTLWPLCVPAGTLGNRQALLLLPEQPVMIESDMADMLFGEPFPLIAAAELDGFRGIQRVHPGPGLGVVQLQFDQDEVVFAADGAMLLCAGQCAVEMAALAHGPAHDGYETLSGVEVEMLVDCLHSDVAFSSSWSQGAGAPAQCAA